MQQHEGTFEGRNSDRESGQRNDWIEKNKIGRWICWLMPGLMYVIGETIMGNLAYIGWVPMLLNVSIYYLLYTGALVWFRTTKYSWPVWNLVLFFLAAAEYFVISFRERPAMFWDILAIRTAMTVSANYKFVLTPTLAGAGLATVVLCIAAWKWPITVGNCKESWKQRLGRVAVWAGSALVFGALLFCVWAPKYKLDVLMWDPVVSFEKEGYLLSSVLSFKAVIAPKPDGYSAERAEELRAKAEFAARGAWSGDGGTGTEICVTAVRPTNVICIMNESYSDLRLFNGLTSDDRYFETDVPFMDYFDSLKHVPNTQIGDLYVPVFGAMTANSEYEFLTGNSCTFVPQGSIPYQLYTKSGDNSLAKIFSDLGYSTVAMHPYPGYNWNRTEAYENLGFDEFLDQEFYEELEARLSADGNTEFFRPRNYMSDRSDYDAILHLLREKTPGENMFIFNVTMQNHGGFEVEGLESTVHVTELNGESCKGEYPKADQYLTLIQMSDDALEYLLDELSKLSEPTMVVMFGDHQPSVETEFFEALYGMRWADVPSELKLNSFRTLYMIWTNYDRSVEDAGDMSAFLLGSEVLKAAGVEQNGLFAAANRLRVNYDAIHAMGVRKKDGTFLDSRESDVFREEEMLHDYHMIQYYEIFDLQ